MTKLGELNRDESIDRRRFLRRAGTVAWSTPVIMTVLASRAGAQPCGQLGGPCSPTTPRPCCPGLICCSAATTRVGTCRKLAGADCVDSAECCQNCPGPNPKKCQGT